MKKITKCFFLFGSENYGVDISHMNFNQVKQTVKKQRDPKLAERFEKRLTDELHKIFDDADSFYYSRTLDITNSLQRQYEIEKVLETEDGGGKTITDITRWWKHVDDRFFWNKHMLKDIIALDVSLVLLHNPC